MSVANWPSFKPHPLGTEPTEHRIGHVACSCGWSVSRPTEAEARSAGLVHRLLHLARGESS
jgi:hypothetical protein